ncbi:hypothetical protein [Chryseobacterium sp.]|uniref:hypothetical protein n=1 Tax=Chryseobacterium sp. TaxID=1871047 RepID=UPI002612268E|nr:hypothetical protein [Chryseobacterium sp.]
MNITINLPVSPAIKKYLTTRLGNNYHLTNNDWFGIIFLNMLENKNNKYYEFIGKKTTNRIETFPITISLSMADKNGFIIRAKHETQINKIIDDVFRQDMYIQALINKKEYGIEYQTSLSNILDAYDITDEELTIDSLKRDFIRKRADIESKLFI